MALEKQKDDLFTLVEINFHAECRVVLSWRSESPKEPKSYPKLKAMATDVLKDQRQILLTSVKQKGRVKDCAILVATVAEKEEIADSGHQHARAQEVHIVHSGTTTEMDPKSDKNTACSEFRRRKTRQPQAHQEQKVDLRSASFMKEDSAEQVRFVPSTASATMTRRRVPNASHSQTRSRTSGRTIAACSRNGKHPC